MLIFSIKFGHKGYFYHMSIKTQRPINGQKGVNPGKNQARVFALTPSMGVNPGKHRDRVSAPP